MAHPEDEHEQAIIVMDDWDLCPDCRIGTPGTITSYYSNGEIILSVRNCMSCKEQFIRKL